MKRNQSHVRRTIAATGLAVGLLTAPMAHASEPVLQPASPLARFFLPFSPFVFDVVIQVSRSFAEVTYGQRAYDPITQNFVISDLHVRRDSVDVSIRRLRFGEDLMMAEGVSVDTKNLPLPPPLRDGLTRLGRETVVANLVATLRRDDARSALAVDLALDVDGVGALSMQGVVDNFHILVPLSEMTGDFSTQPVVAGVLKHASVSYKDAGFAAVANAIAAEQQGVSAEDLRNGLAVMPVMSVADLLSSLPGGASPALQERATGWARVVEAFIRTPDRISVSLNPLEPVPLALLQTGRFDEETLVALNPDVTNGSATPKLAGQPANPIEAAAAMITGAGVLQDRESGARKLLTLAGGGDVDAVHELAATFGVTTTPDLQPAELADLYKYLLVARALGDQVSDGALSAFGTKLGPNLQRVTELAASAYFKGMTEAGRAMIFLSPDTIKTYDAGQLRVMAYDTYEGRGVTRNFTEAYAIALVAAAAGDPLAVSLRDNLASAAADKRVVLSMDEARTRAAALWAGYAGAASTQP